MVSLHEIVFPLSDNLIVLPCAVYRKSETEGFSQLAVSSRLHDGRWLPKRAASQPPNPTEFCRCARVCNGPTSFWAALSIDPMSQEKQR